MNGYEFCKMILEAPNGGVEALLESANYQEQEWLEFKASTQLLEDDKKKGYSQDDLYWNIANAIIGMMNTCGGAVIIGIDDKNHDFVPLPDKNIDKYFRTVYSKVWGDDNRIKNWGTKKYSNQKRLYQTLCLFNHINTKEKRLQFF